MDVDRGGKLKTKRNHEANKPYTRSPSLFGKVSDTVKDMLSPSWLVDLVASVKRKTPPIRSKLEGSSVPLVNQSIPNDGSSFIQPDVNRVTVGETTSGEMSTATAHVTQSSDSINQPNDMNFTYGQMQYNNYRTFHSNYPQVNGGDDHSEHSDYSVSTNTSMQPQLSRQASLQTNAQYSRDLSGPEVEQGNRSTTSEKSFLWSKCPTSTSSSVSTTPTARSRKPTFTVSAFGANVTSPENSLFGSTYHKSPYYPGKTTFGGAAAHRKSRQNSPSPYQVIPQRKVVTAKPAQKLSSSSVTSSTAKRILDTLERMSTPLSDAKKIPSYDSREIDSTLSFTPATYRRTSLSRSPSLRDTTKNGPPVQRRSSPSLASIATNRRPIRCVQETSSILSEEKLNNNNNDEYFKKAPPQSGTKKKKVPTATLR